LARDRGALASGWLSSLLALEIAGTERAAALIQRMSVENVLWGAPRIQGDITEPNFRHTRVRLNGDGPTVDLANGADALLIWLNSLAPHRELLI
jgi:hypothetical protein